MFISAGVMRLSLLRFIVADGIAAIFGHTLLFFFAWWFGDQFKDLVVRAEQNVDRLKPLIILLVLAAIAGFGLYHFLRRPVSTADPQELPLIGGKMAAKIESAADIAVPPPEKTEAAPAPQPSVDGKGPEAKTEQRVSESGP